MLQFISSRLLIGYVWLLPIFSMSQGSSFVFLTRIWTSCIFLHNDWMDRLHFFVGDFYHQAKSQRPTTILPPTADLQVVVPGTRFLCCFFKKRWSLSLKSFMKIFFQVNYTPHYMDFGTWKNLRKANLEYSKKPICFFHLSSLRII